MGLDQSACLEMHMDAEGVSGLEGWASSDSDQAEKDAFYWRKHSRLHVFMMQEANPGGSDDINCKALELTMDIINKLEQAINNEYADYFCSGGFFWGHQWQEETAKHYKNNDLAFVDWARKKIRQDVKVFYTCSY